MATPSSSAFDSDLIAALRGARFVAALTGAGISAESGLATFRDAQTGLWAKEPLNGPHAECVASKMRMDARRAPKVVVDATNRGAQRRRHRILPQPEGTGLFGRSALLRGSLMGPAISFASRRASYPEKPPSQPCGARSEVLYFDPRELATPGAFARNPKLVWDWYAWRREHVAAAQPNAGHLALAELEGRVREFALITQNVDGLHQRAGSRNPIELHGNITRVKCSREGTIVERWEAPPDALPRCGNCGAPLRPDVVWFEEMLPERALAAADAAVRRCNVLLVIGTSAEVYPAAALPALARLSGAIVVEINPEATPLSAIADFALRGAAGIVLPALVAALD